MTTIGCRTLQRWCAVNYKTIDQFYDRADALRGVFDRRFKEPLQASAERFVWDYWHVPGEYTHLRTPAFNYFPRAIYERFHRHLVKFGREQLGCHDISPPWLSCYVEGCRQEPHQDVPHGPLAFVFSLTPWSNRTFTGGETFIVRPRVRIEPRYNRLTVFNPALVHGVRPIRGTHDPRKGRLVVHGWFVNPRPFWVGPLKPMDVQDGLDRGLDKINFATLEPGFASYRLKISASGHVQIVRPLIDTFQSAKVGAQLVRSLKTFTFCKQKRATWLTFPLRID